ncbi:polysaccharide biosynthesis protein GumN [Agrobacterium larrymoorei]|uniref:TraB/GumN family protein n=1 Tax=Agrobacterium larrymoorei TaxID=160699 RepID=UPI0015726B42|nr:TraB/GumN family protein [Agrobacterium larrymoorei]NTJ43275.1 polysaccharide biosynthesis protein GumN [Agrobacterium larrymoorei]
MTVLSRPQGLTSLLMGRLGNALLWLLASVHLAALVVLLLTLFTMTEANASEDHVTCGGSDILTGMQKADPAAFAAIVAEAKKIPNGTGTFWKVEKDGIEPSWLLGTMHISDPRVLDMPNGAAQAFAAAKTVIVESDEITSEKKAAAALLARPDLTMFLDGKSITDMLPMDEVAKLEQGLKDRGIPLNAVLKMKPWILSSFVALPACEFARKANGASFLDMKLANDALSKGKKLVGLETLVEQMSAISELPMSFHVQSLIEMLQLGDRMEDIMATMIDLYLKGEIGMITPMMKSISPEQNAEARDGYAAFEKRIITDRNHVMADRATPHLETGSVFMAVGALHLPGEEGVIELLRQKGFTLTAVQ